jgi:hypothetical protein
MVPTSVRMMGPIRPRRELIFRAVWTCPNFTIKRPALISIVPAMRRSKAMVKTARISVVMKSLRFRDIIQNKKEGKKCLNT